MVIFHVLAVSSQVVDYVGTPIHDREIVIYCNFTAKPPGSPEWRLSTQKYTELCDLVIDDGTRSENEECFGSPNSGDDAHLAFNLMVNYTTHNGRKWNCLLNGLPEYLDLEVQGRRNILLTRNRFACNGVKISVKYLSQNMILKQYQY